MGKKSVAVFFIVEYGESVVNVPKVHQRPFSDVEKFRFLVANKMFANAGPSSEFIATPSICRKDGAIDTMMTQWRHLFHATSLSN